MTIENWIGLTNAWVLSITFVVLFWYAWETMQMAKATQKMAQSAEDQGKAISKQADATIKQSEETARQAQETKRLAVEALQARLESQQPIIWPYLLSPGAINGISLGRNYVNIRLSNLGTATAIDIWTWVEKRTEKGHLQVIATPLQPKESRDVMFSALGFSGQSEFGDGDYSIIVEWRNSYNHLWRTSQPIQFCSGSSDAKPGIVSGPERIATRGRPLWTETSQPEYIIDPARPGLV